MNSIFTNKTPKFSRFKKFHIFISNLEVNSLAIILYAYQGYEGQYLQSRGLAVASLLLHELYPTSGNLIVFGTWLFVTVLLYVLFSSVGIIYGTLTAII